MGKVVARVRVGKQRGDVVAGKVRGFEQIDDLISLDARGGEAENGFLGHGAWVE
jgi:hypothetical protein